MTRENLLNLLKDNLPTDIKIFDKGHGWHEQVILVRLKMADLLVSVVTGGVSISCMCFVSAPETSYDKVIDPSNVINEINRLMDHSCVPWPG